MQESVDQEPSRKGSDSEQETAGADSEATSKETLSDLEENTKSVGTSSPPEPGPSPDGALDENDEGKYAGPM